MTEQFPTVEVLPDGTPVVDGDVGIADDLDPIDRPDPTLVAEEALRQQREAVKATVLEMLVDADGLSQQANAKGIHSATRVRYREAAGAIGIEADALIAGLLGLDVRDEDSKAPIANERARLRTEALEAVAAERRAKQTPELGKRAFVAPEFDALDARSRAAGEGSRSPWAQD